MPGFHNRALQLLDRKGIPKENPVPGLADWSEANRISLPGAYVEWATLDPDGRLLSTYSPGDRLWFSPRELILTPDGFRGIAFQQDRSGAYTKIVLLDRGEDPPVLWGWKNQAPWIEHAGSFSDCVFAQIFDWQYRPKPRSLRSKPPEGAGEGHVVLLNDRCVSVLRDLYPEFPRTAFAIESKICTEFRFLKSEKERLTVTVGSGRAEIRITGKLELVKALESRLLGKFAADGAKLRRPR